jgi:hypothetical protein
VIVADESLSTKSPQVTFASALTVPLPQATGEGAERRFLVETASLAEGFYLVSSIGIEDSAGNLGGGPVAGVVLEVDRSVPLVQDVAFVDPPADGVFADLSGSGREILAVRFTSNDVLDPERTRVSLGPLESSSCTHADTGVVTCTLDLASGGAPDGLSAVEIDIADMADNTGHGQMMALVDAEAPGIVAGSVQLEVELLGQELSAAVPGSTIHVAFVSSEDLSDAPTATLQLGGSSVPFSVEGANRIYTLEYQVPAGIDAGQGTVLVTLEDRVGHVAVVGLGSDIPFAATVVSDCPVPAAIVCPDVDGDGVSPVPGCSLAPDCNDTDATVFPDAPELPGDGRANACGGEELAIAASVGVFYDPTRGSGGVGSPDDPYGDLFDASASGADFIFAASGAQTFLGTQTIDATMIGSLDPVTWQRSETPTEITAPNVNLTEGRGLVGVTLHIPESSDLTLQGDNLVVEVTTRGDIAALRSVSRIVRSVDFFLLTHAQSLMTYVADSSLRGCLALAPAELHRVRSRRYCLALDANASITIVNSVISENGTVAALECEDCRELRLVHSTVISGGTSSPGPAVQTNGAMFILNSIVFGFGDDTAVPLIQVDTAGALTLAGSDVVRHAPLGNLIRLNDGTELNDASEVNGCVATGCVEMHDNVSVHPNFVSGFTYAIDIDSPVVDVGVDHVRLPEFPTAVTDIDGACRYAGAAVDMGADEVP